MRSTTARRSLAAAITLAVAVMLFAGATRPRESRRPTEDSHAALATPSRAAPGKSGARVSARPSAVAIHAAQSTDAPAEPVTAIAAPSSSGPSTDVARLEQPPPAPLGNPADGVHPRSSASTARSAGMMAAIDPETGRLTAPTAAQRAALGQKSLGLDRSDEGLEVIVLPGGAEMVRLDDRFMEYAVARIDASRRISTDCVQGPRMAEQLRQRPVAPVRVEE